MKKLSLLIAAGCLLNSGFSMTCMPNENFASAYMTGTAYEEGDHTHVFGTVHCMERRGARIYDHYDGGAVIDTRDSNWKKVGDYFDWRCTAGVGACQFRIPVECKYTFPQPKIKIMMGPPEEEREWKHKWNLYECPPGESGLCPEVLEKLYKDFNRGS